MLKLVVAVAASLCALANGQALPVQDAGAITVPKGAAAAGKGILGKIKINGAVYEATCDCSKDALERASKTLTQEKEDIACRLPSKYRIFYQKAAMPVDQKDMLTSAQLLKFLPKPSDLQFVDVKKRTLRDVDGRQKGHVVGAFGGEIGEFILALSVYSRILGHDPKEPFNSERYLRAWLNETQAKRSFAFNWDADATEKLKADIEEDRAFDLNGPPDALKKKILGLDCKTQPCGLANPANIGIRHIKEMMKDADRQENQMNGQMNANGYMVPKNLLVETIRAAFTVLWDENSPLKQVMKYTTVPKSSTEEKAFVMFNVASGCRAKGFSPAIPVKNSMGASIFAYHPDAVAVRRHELCDFFERMDTSGHVKKDAMCRQLERQGNLHLTLSARSMSKNMPTYSVNIL